MILINIWLCIYICILYTINIDHRCIDLYVHIPFRFSAHWAHPTCKLHLDLWSIWPQPWPIRPMLSDPPDPSPSLGPPAPSPFWFRFSSNVETSHSPDLNPKKKRWVALSKLPRLCHQFLGYQNSSHRRVDFMKFSRSLVDAQRTDTERSIGTKSSSQKTHVWLGL